jgi:hypothetical protein
MYLERMTVMITRDGEEYTARVDPPELDYLWESSEPLGRVALQREIESLGVHPIDVADAFDQADLRGGYPTEV